MNFVIFLIDGFNLYHSIRELENDWGLRAKWLDIKALCQSLLPLISKDTTLKDIYYFSAFAYHLNDPAVIKRHEDYKKCLEATGIITQMGKFKPKEILCTNCHRKFWRYEEKETDVAIAVKLCEILEKGASDTVMVMTGDTDIAPAIRTAQQIHPKRVILCAFPYKRKNKELAQLTKCFKIRQDRYIKYQLPNPFVLPDGSIINKPTTW
jgi:uncharacterized LabA/DUF88 family protein